MASVATAGQIDVHLVEDPWSEKSIRGSTAPAPGLFFEDLRREVNLFSEREGALVTESFEFLD